MTPTGWDGSRDALDRRRQGCRARWDLTSQMGRFETEWLASDENLTALTDLPGRWIDCVNGCRSLRSIVLDMDSSVSPTYGDQEGTA